MSYKVKNSSIQDVIVARPEVFSNRKLKVKTIYWLARLEKELQKNFKILSEERMKLLADRCLKDGNGKPIIKNGIYEFAEDNSRDEALKQVNELMDLEVEIQIDKLRIVIDELQDSISANEMLLLEPFVDFVEKIET